MQSARPGLTINNGGTVRLGGPGGGASAYQFDYHAPVTVNGGTLDLAGNSMGIDALNGSSGLITNSGSNTTLGVGTAGGSGSYSGVIAGPIAVSKGGAGTQTLSGHNTYSWFTLVEQGTLVVGSDDALGTQGSTRIDGGTLDLNGHAVVQSYLRIETNFLSPGGTLLNSAHGGSSFTTTGTSNPDAIILDAPVSTIAVTQSDGSLTLNGRAVSAQGHSLAKVGLGTLILNGNNDLAGDVHVNAGTLKLAQPHAAGSANLGGKTTVALGASLDVNGQLDVPIRLSIQGGGVGGAGALLNSSANAASLTSPGVSLTLAGPASIGVTQTNGTLTINEPIVGGYMLTKVGAGKLILNGAVAGPIALGAGTLTLAGGGNRHWRLHQRRGQYLNLENTPPSNSPETSPTTEASRSTT